MCLGMVFREQQHLDESIRHFEQRPRIDPRRSDRTGRTGADAGHEECTTTKTGGERGSCEGDEREVPRPEVPLPEVASTHAKAP